MRRPRALSLVAVTAAVATVGTPGDAQAPVHQPRFQALPAHASAMPPGRGFVTAWLERKVAVRARPGGRIVARMNTRTSWGTPRILSVLTVRGEWLGVSTELRPNGRLGWIPASATRLTRVDEAFVADLSQRRLTLLRDGRPVRRIRVAIGRPANPTPTGRFAITDLLLVREASPYGCCVIALSGRQPRVPPDWPGGDRLAIHATNDTSSIGRAASIGCLRARERDMRWLIRQELQPGTPVFIRR